MAVAGFEPTNIEFWVKWFTTVIRLVAENIPITFFKIVFKTCKKNWNWLSRVGRFDLFTNGLVYCDLFRDGWTFVFESTTFDFWGQQRTRKISRNFQLKVERRRRVERRFERRKTSRRRRRRSSRRPRWRRVRRAGGDRRKRQRKDKRPGFNVINLFFLHHWWRGLIS